MDGMRDELDRDTGVALAKALPVVKAVIGGLKPDATIITDKTIEYHFHGPIVINIGYNAETHLGDAAIKSSY